MEVVGIKKILAQNLIIYIGLHCVRRSSWTVTTLATLMISRWYSKQYDATTFFFEGLPFLNFYRSFIFALSQFRISMKCRWISIMASISMHLIFFFKFRICSSLIWGTTIFQVISGFGWTFTIIHSFSNFSCMLLNSNIFFQFEF